MSTESKYIINQINQAPKDFKGDESSYILDKINQKKDNPDIKKLHSYFKEINPRIVSSFNNPAIPYMMADQIYKLAGEDVKSSKKIIEDIDRIIKATPDYENLSEGDYQQIWDDLVYNASQQQNNPFLQGLPLENQMMPEDFR